MKKGSKKLDSETRSLLFRAKEMLNKMFDMEEGCDIDDLAEIEEIVELIELYTGTREDQTTKGTGGL